MTMRHRILDASIPSDRAEWLGLWERWPGREVFAHPEYVRLFARPGDRSVCAVGEDEGGTILFPLVLRPLVAEPWAAPGERRWDAVSPYGYGGPFAFGEGPRDDGAFWRAHDAFCRDAGVITTFARLSLFDAQLPRLPGQVEGRGPNVVRDLGPDLGAIWMEYERSVRANVKTAERLGVDIELDRTGARLDAFVEVYEHTMLRRGANGWYFFPRSFFEELTRGLAGQYVFFHALHGGEVVSSELILVSREHAYMLLSGTRAEAYPLRPNDLLRHRTVQWGAAAGLQAYVLGGGYEPGDGVYRHKKNFAPRGQLEFRVACLTHDAAAARELEERRAAESGWAPRSGYFPRYRG
jgi:CelD/BcsL family acetyltransferase involved in cellulose biosynthesis